MKLKLKIQLWLIAALALLALSLILSRSATPDVKPLFTLKRVQEKVFLKLKSSPQERLDYMISILNTRLQEMGDLVNKKSYGYVLPTSLRYSTLAGQITDFIIASNLKDSVQSTKQIFIDHQKTLNDLYILYPKNIPDNEEWKYI